MTSSVSGKRSPAELIARASRPDVSGRGGGDGNRTRVDGFAGRCLTTRPLHRKGIEPGEDVLAPRSLRADDGIRTRDPHLGKVMRYQLRHIRIAPRLAVAHRVARMNISRRSSGNTNRGAETSPELCGPGHGTALDRAAPPSHARPRVPRTPHGPPQPVRMVEARMVEADGRGPTAQLATRARAITHRDPHGPRRARPLRARPPAPTPPAGPRPGYPVSDPPTPRGAELGHGPGLDTVFRCRGETARNARSYSSAEERSVHTGEVTGSNPVRTTLEAGESPRRPPDSITETGGRPHFSRSGPCWQRHDAAAHSPRLPLHVSNDGAPELIE